MKRHTIISRRDLDRPRYTALVGTIVYHDGRPLRVLHVEVQADVWTAHVDDGEGEVVFVPCHRLTRGTQ